MKLLFICNQNKHRSKTAEELFKDKFEVKSAGLYNENPVTEQQILWADVIVVMEKIQRTEIVKRFPTQTLQKKIICFDVPDFYGYGQDRLVKLLETKFDLIV